MGTWTLKIITEFLKVILVWGFGVLEIGRASCRERV